MIARRFKEADYKTIARWYRERDIAPPRFELLPSTGFIVNDVAAGFIYLTDSALCLVDGLISNPDCSPLRVGRALQLLSKVLVGQAIKCGAQGVVVLTKSRTIAKLATSREFSYTGEYSNYYLEL